MLNGLGRNQTSDCVPQSPVQTTDLASVSSLDANIMPVQYSQHCRAVSSELLRQSHNRPTSSASLNELRQVIVAKSVLTLPVRTGRGGPRLGGRPRASAASSYLDHGTSI